MTDRESNTRTCTGNDNKAQPAPLQSKLEIRNVRLHVPGIATRKHGPRGASMPEARHALVMPGAMEERHHQTYVHAATGLCSLAGKPAVGQHTYPTACTAATVPRGPCRFRHKNPAAPRDKNRTQDAKLTTHQGKARDVHKLAGIPLMRLNGATQWSPLDLWLVAWRRHPAVGTRSSSESKDLTQRDPSPVQQGHGHKRAMPKHDCQSSMPQVRVLISRRRAAQRGTARRCFHRIRKPSRVPREEADATFLSEADTRAGLSHTRVFSAEPQLTDAMKRELLGTAAETCGRSSKHKQPPRRLTSHQSPVRSLLNHRDRTGRSASHAPSWSPLESSPRTAAAGDA